MERKNIGRKFKGTKTPAARSNAEPAQKSVTFSVRLDPRDRFAADLASRAQTRTVTNFIEWAVRKALRDVQVEDYGKSVLSIVDQVWDPSEADRVMKLAFSYPRLLSVEEDVIFKTVLGYEAFWKKDKDRSLSSLNLNLVRGIWDDLKIIGDKGGPSPDAIREIISIYRDDIGT